MIESYTSHLSSDENHETPEGWALPRVAEILEVNYGKGLPEKRRSPGNIPVYGSNGVIGYHSKPLTRGSTIVIGRKGTVGAVHFSLEPCWPIDTTYFIEQFNGLEPFYVYHALRYLNLAELDTSTAIPGLNRDELYDQRLPLAPLAEQKRIVAKIEELLARVNATRERLAKVPAILKRFRQAVLAAACSGRLTQDWRTINSDFEPAEVRLARACRARVAEYEKLCSVAAESRRRKPRRPSNLEPEIRHTEFEFQMPKGWFWASIEDIASIRQHALSSGPFGSVLGTKDYRESGIPVIRGQNIQEGNFRSKNLTYVSNEKAATLSRSTTYPGDIVVVAVGTSGQAAIVPDNLPRSILSQNCNKITVDESLVIPEFILLSLRNDIAKDQLTERTTDTARPFLSLTNLKKTVIAIPSIDEQREIVRKSKALLKIADAVDNRLNAAWEYREKLAQSMLVRAFRGELVPTEAEIARGEGRSYESAGELLRRIKDERESTRQLPHSKQATSRVSA